MAATSAELALLRRRGAVALASCTAALAALVVFAVNAEGTLAPWWISATAVACALTALPLGVAVGRLVSSSSPVAFAGGEPGDVFDDLAPLFALRPVRRLALPEHPWRLPLVTAAAVWIAGLAAGWYAEGGLEAGVLRGTIEAVALVICFSLLGRFLGLRRSPR